MCAVDRPMDYGVYFLFHDWWQEAPEEAIEGYMQELNAIPNAREFLDQRYISDPVPLARLAECDEGTLGRGYHDFVVDNQLEVNLARNYHDFNKQLHDAGNLERLPEDMSYMMVRGFQIHDMQHVLTGYDSTPYGELALAAFYLAQLRFPYHLMRMAVTLGHAAFVNPGVTVDAMDAIVDGWTRGRQAKNLNFTRWEDELDTPVVELQEQLDLRIAA